MGSAIRDSSFNREMVPISSKYIVEAVTTRNYLALTSRMLTSNEIDLWGITSTHMTTASFTRSP